MASRMSAGVTMPSKCPYSSWMSAIGTTALRNTSRRVKGVCRVRYHWSLADVGFEVERLAGCQRSKWLSGPHHTSKCIRRSLSDRHRECSVARMRLLGRCREINPIDPRARRHETEHPSITKPQTARHAMFVGFEYASALGLAALHMW